MPLGVDTLGCHMISCGGMSTIRQQIYQVIEVKETASIASKVYNHFMLLVVMLGLLPLAFKEDYPVFAITDMVVVVLFGVDYLLHWLTADIRTGKKGVLPFLVHPFTPFAIIDMLSILSTLSFLQNAFRLFRLSRGVRLLRVLSLFKVVQHSRNMRLVMSTIRDTRDSLITVGYLALGYILLCALIIFNVEPDTFGNFFDAIYWATISLTTVGYGDVYPVSLVGRCVAMVSSMLGIALVALPAGIVTAGYMNALQRSKEEESAD